MPSLLLLKLFHKDKIYSPPEQICGYTISKILGEGRYGICYLVYKDATPYILKQLKKEMLKSMGYKVAYEQEILSKIHHESIPKFIEKVEYKKFSGYVLEYKEGKTFEDIIFEEEYIFKNEEIYCIGLQLINILEYLYAIGVVHRDVRLPNVLYNKGKIFLLDFGLARWITGNRYTFDVDFSFLGDFLLHLYYTAYEDNGDIERPWYEELDLSKNEKIFLKRLLGIEHPYRNIEEVKKDFLLLF